MDGLDDSARACDWPSSFSSASCLGSLVNWAIYTFAWNPRPISPWSRRRRSAAAALVPIGCRSWLVRAAPRSDAARPRFWMRPMLLEIGLGVALAALYWWEVVRLGLMRDQTFAAVAPPIVAAALAVCQSRAAACAGCWRRRSSTSMRRSFRMKSRSRGTLLGLMLATLVPMSLLPHVAERPAPPVVRCRRALIAPAGGPAIGPNGDPLWLEPVTAVSPNEWPPIGARRAIGRRWRSRSGCYWLWCFALAPRIWRGRRGPLFALRLDRQPCCAANLPGRRCVGCLSGVARRRSSAVWAIRRARLGRACSRR